MKKYVTWLGFVLILVIIFGTIYAVVLQSQRTDANYPQIQIAEDTAAALDSGSKVSVLTAGHITINTSLAPFTIIYSKDGKIISGNGFLNGHLPAAPLGILKNADGKDYHWISWQPQADVRIAAVTVAADNYYVLSGRSLKEIEKNESLSLEISFFGGVASLIVLTALYITRERLSRR